MYVYMSFLRNGEEATQVCHIFPKQAASAGIAHANVIFFPS